MGYIIIHRNLDVKIECFREENLLLASRSADTLKCNLRARSEAWNKLVVYVCTVQAKLPKCLSPLSQISTKSINFIAEVQQLVKVALYNLWKNSMSNDWLYDDDRRKFSLVQFYTQLEWTRMLEGPIHITEHTMTSICDLFTIDLVKTGIAKIFIQGEKILWTIIF